MNKNTELISYLVNYRQADDILAGSPFIRPNYDGYSIYNLPASICSWLDIPVLNGTPLSGSLHQHLQDKYQHVILLLIDGLGYDWLNEYLNSDSSLGLNRQQIWNRFFGNCPDLAITSIAPSTTATALTTLWTGAYPAEHGVMGYEMWLKEYGILANMITHAPASYTGDAGSIYRAGFRLEDFLPVPTLGPHFKENQVKAFSFMPGHISNSSLTKMHTPDITVIPFYAISDLWASMQNIYQANIHEKTYHFLYWGLLDELMHRFGPQDQRVQMEMDSFLMFMANFLDRFQDYKDTLFIITADHGSKSTPVNSRYNLQSYPELYDSLVMQPGGEQRLAYLYLRNTNNRFVNSQKDWQDDFVFYPSRDVLTAGLFGNGKFHPNINDRIGDIIAAAKGQAYWWGLNRPNRLLGRHGGLSRDEMLVPFIALSSRG